MRWLASVFVLLTSALFNYSTAHAQPSPLEMRALVQEYVNGVYLSETKRSDQARVLLETFEKYITDEAAKKKVKYNVKLSMEHATRAVIKRLDKDLVYYTELQPNQIANLHGLFSEMEIAAEETYMSLKNDFKRAYPKLAFYPAAIAIAFDIVWTYLNGHPRAIDHSGLYNAFILYGAIFSTVAVPPWEVLILREYLQSFRENTHYQDLIRDIIRARLKWCPAPFED